MPFIDIFPTKRFFCWSCDPICTRENQAPQLTFHILATQK